MLGFACTVERIVSEVWLFQYQAVQSSLVLIHPKKCLPSFKRLSCRQNQSLTLPWTILLTFDIPHMQNHLLQVTREVEKLEFHGL